ncbi:unnamed protein product [Linum tenue]|uniref:FAR1 domain-containing protein n=1 Tax=Linum tenue TaxID=586396 RepID=A0AAV0ME56_9ROSI|nr:unnamed protein product [Linum tenue]
MNDYISDDYGSEWVGVESTCIFGLDLNVPLTINDDDIYDCDAEQTDPAVNGADPCMVDVDPVLDMEEALNEDHPERHDNTENNDKFVRHSGDRVDVDDGVVCNYGGVLTSIVPSDKSTWDHLRFQNQDEFNRFYKSFAHGRGFSSRVVGAVKKKRSYFPEPFVFYFGGSCSKQGYKKGSRLDPKNAEEVVDSEPPNERERGETRFGCNAIAMCSYERASGKYKIYRWTDNHVHEMHNAFSRSFMRSNREVPSEYAYFAEINDCAGIPIQNSLEEHLNGLKT